VYYHPAVHSRSVVGGLGGGLSGPVPKDVWILLAVVFVTFSLQHFSGTRILPELLRLTPLVWHYGFLWQLVTYPFSGIGPPSLWILLELLILFWFARDVFWLLRRRAFWQLIVVVALAAALVAVAVELVARLLGGGGGLVVPFTLMQGQRMLIVIIIAAFATLRREATILLFFILPIQAKYFLALEILFAFVAFLGYHDFAGFVGICAGVGITYTLLTRGRLSSILREGRLRLERWWIQMKMARLRRRRGMRVVRGEKEKKGGNGPWVH
jgi:hypothetical protein